MTTQFIFAILQNNVKNEKKDMIISFLIDFRIKNYDLLIIQKS